VAGPRCRTASFGVVRREASSLVRRLRGDWPDLECEVPEARDDMRDILGFVSDSFGGVVVG